MAVRLRDLHSLDDFRRVSQLESEIWGSREESVPTAVFAAAVPRGAVLIGAFEDEDCVGFAYSFPAIVHGKLIHWSHVTGSRPRTGAGVGFALKQAQRDRVRRLGLDRIDWTFDPLQAANAHSTSTAWAPSSIATR